MLSCGENDRNNTILQLKLNPSFPILEQSHFNSFYSKGPRDGFYSDSPISHLFSHGWGAQDTVWKVPMQNRWAGVSRKKDAHNKIPVWILKSPSVCMRWIPMAWHKTIFGTWILIKTELLLMWCKISQEARRWSSPYEQIHLCLHTLSFAFTNSNTQHKTV